MPALCARFQPQSVSQKAAFSLSTAGWLIAANRALTGPHVFCPTMCGIGGAVSLSLSPLRNAQGTVELMNDLLRHRGPDGEATWVHEHEVVAFAHRRLAIIDL